MKLRLIPLCLALLLIALGLEAHGQDSESCSFKGTITNQLGRGFANATIRADSQLGGKPIVTQSGGDGTFDLPVPCGGSYTVTISADNFKRRIFKDQIIQSGEPTTDLHTVGLSVGPEIVTPHVVNLLCGAFILFLIDIWLRRRGVTDPSLIYLYLTLVSWSLGGLVQLLGRETIFGISTYHIKYVLSPASTILFVLTAFRLSRVRDAISPERLRAARLIIIIATGALSIVGVVFTVNGQNERGAWVDATASFMAGIVLLAALFYSFYRYGNQILAWTSAFVLIIFIARQFYVAGNTTPTHGLLVPLFLADSSLLIMVFIALAVAWGLSDASRLKPVAISAPANVMALFFDLRGSTTWANDIAERDFNYVREFIEELRKWAWDQVHHSPEGHPRVTKFLGDGSMSVWEVQNGRMTNGVGTTVQFGCDLSTRYRSWIRSESFTKKFPWGVPKAIGVGVDVGPAIRFTLENGSDDYLGSPLNLAAKMQDVARPNGGVVIRQKVWELLDESLQKRFPNTRVVRLGDQSITLRMTEDIPPQNGETSDNP